MLDKIKNFFSDLKDVILLILGGLVTILGALFWYEKKQNEVQKAKNLNAETKGKVEAINDQISSIEKETKDKENEPVTKDDLLNYLNSNNKPK